MVTGRYSLGARLPSVDDLCAHFGVGEFAVIMTGRMQIAKVCDDLSLPYVVLNGFTRGFPNARAVIQEDFRKCFAELIRALRARRLKSVLEFDIERAMDRGFKNQFFEAGISVRRVC